MVEEKIHKINNRNQECKIYNDAKYSNVLGGILKDSVMFNGSQSIYLLTCIDVHIDIHICTNISACKLKRTKGKYDSL